MHPNEVVDEARRLHATGPVAVAVARTRRRSEAVAALDVPSGSRTWTAPLTQRMLYPSF